MKIKVVILLVMVGLVKEHQVSGGVLAGEPVDLYPQYSFGYSVQDHLTGDIKGQSETRSGEVVQGQYSLVEPDGSLRTVTYRADENGFNAVVDRQAGYSAAIPNPVRILKAQTYAVPAAPSISHFPIHTLPQLGSHPRPVIALPQQRPPRPVQVILPQHRPPPQQVIQPIHVVHPRPPQQVVVQQPIQALPPQQQQTPRPVQVIPQQPQPQPPPVSQPAPPPPPPPPQQQPQQPDPIPQFPNDIFESDDAIEISNDEIPQNAPIRPQQPQFQPQQPQFQPQQPQFQPQQPQQPQFQPTQPPPPPPPPTQAPVQAPQPTRPPPPPPQQVVQQPIAPARPPPQQTFDDDAIEISADDFSRAAGPSRTGRGSGFTYSSSRGNQHNFRINV